MYQIIIALVTCSYHLIIVLIVCRVRWIPNYNSLGYLHLPFYCRTFANYFSPTYEKRFQRRQKLRKKRKDEEDEERYGRMGKVGNNGKGKEEWER